MYISSNHRFAPASLGADEAPASSGLQKALDITGSPIFHVATGALSAYHGYKRNKKSLLWAAIWGAGGYVAPVIALPLAVIQGFGKRKK